MLFPNAFPLSEKLGINISVAERYAYTVIHCMLSIGTECEDNVFIIIFAITWVKTCVHWVSVNGERMVDFEVVVLYCYGIPPVTCATLFC